MPLNSPFEELYDTYSDILTRGLALQKALADGQKPKEMASLSGEWAKRVQSADKSTALLATKTGPDALTAEQKTILRGKLKEIRQVAEALAVSYGEVRASIAKQSHHIRAAKMFAADQTHVSKGSLLNSKA